MPLYQIPGATSTMVQWVLGFYVAGMDEAATGKADLLPRQPWLDEVDAT